MGDLNYPNISWKDWTTPYNHTHHEFQFIECLRDNFMNQFISPPTRYPEGQRANILDLFIADKTEIVSNITYSSNLGSSDQVSFIAELNCVKDNVDSKTIERIYYKGDYNSIRNKLSGIEWNTMDEMNVEDSWNFLLKHVCDSIEKHVPLKKVNLTRKKQRWVDSACLNNIKAIKYKAWNRYIHTQDRTDYFRYCKERNRCTKVTRNSKKKFERSVIKNEKVDSKGFKKN